MNIRKDFPKNLLPFAIKMKNELFLKNKGWQEIGNDYFVRSIANKPLLATYEQALEIEMGQGFKTGPQEKEENGI